jgi:hypothetical protein
MLSSPATVEDESLARYRCVSKHWQLTVQQWLPVQLESVDKERAGVDKEGLGLTLFNTRKETEILKHCHLAEIEETERESAKF